MKKNLPFIPYFQTSRYRVETMIELAQVKPGEMAVDLGSGDGRILIALAKAGAVAHGYELDNDLIKMSQECIRQEKIENNIFLHQKDFWDEDLSNYSIVTVYPMPDIMQSLEDKLFSELKPSSRVLLNYYPFPNKSPISIKNNIYVYIV